MPLRVGSWIVGVLALLSLPSALAQSEATDPECHMHQSKAVSFRDEKTADILEISIGTGPCFESD
jgi:hypothetical protein